MISIFIVFALLYWVGMARLVRGQVLSLKGARIRFGGPFDRRFAEFIIRKHLIPNSMSVIIISAGLQIPSAIFTESFLSSLASAFRPRCRLWAPWRAMPKARFRSIRICCSSPPSSFA
jgi:ABC-type dipeptide/oligopeptide/nickel transport system permease subunit